MQDQHLLIAAMLGGDVSEAERALEQILDIGGGAAPALLALTRATNADARS